MKEFGVEGRFTGTPAANGPVLLDFATGTTRVVQDCVVAEHPVVVTNAVGNVEDVEL